MSSHAFAPERAGRPCSGGFTMSKSGREKASVIGSRLRFFRNPRDFPFPLAKGRDAGGDCLARCRPCGRRSGAQQRLPRSFLSPVPVLPTSDQASRRGSLCADHSPVVSLLSQKAAGASGENQLTKEIQAWRTRRLRWIWEERRTVKRGLRLMWKALRA